VDRTRVCLFAVNPGREPVTVAIDLADFGPAYAPRRAVTVRDTLDRRQPDVMNHWSAPERVRTVELPIQGRTLTLPVLSATAITCGGA